MDLRPFLASRPFPFEDAFLVRAPEATSLLLVRHAEAGYAASTGGRPAPPVLYDPPLTERGQGQARLLARRLAAAGVSALYSSPMKRALETAEAVSRAALLPVEVRDGLREIFFRLPSGNTGAPAGDQAREQRRRQMSELMKKAFRWDAFDTTEDRAAFRQRATAEVDAIAGVHPGQTVAIVTHGGLINAYIAQLLGCERDILFPPFNTSVTLVRALREERALVILNDSSHLVE